MIRRVRAITPSEENFRLEPIPGLPLTAVRRDPVKPVPENTYIACVFRVVAYDQDCDGGLMARLEHVDREGRTTGWRVHSIGLYPDSAWVVDRPDELDMQTPVQDALGRDNA